MSNLVAGCCPQELMQWSAHLPCTEVRAGGRMPRISNPNVGLMRPGYLTSINPECHAGFGPPLAGETVNVLVSNSRGPRPCSSSPPSPRLGHRGSQPARRCIRRRRSRCDQRAVCPWFCNECDNRKWLREFAQQQRLSTPPNGAELTGAGASTLGINMSFINR